MKKTFLISAFIFCCFSLKTQSQTVTIQSVGAIDVCSSSIVLQVVNPQPGSSYSWYIGGYGCLNATASAPYALGSQIQTFTTGEFYCIETTSGGIQNISNPLIVRNLPGMAGSMFMPAPGLNSGSTNCVASASLCVPYVYYSNWPGTILKWYKDNVLINGATSGSYTATATGYYKYTVTSGCMTAVSDSSLITISPQVQISTTSTSPICPSQSLSFNIVSPAPGYTYTWQRYVNGSYVDVTTGTSYNFQAPTTGYAIVRAKTTVGSCTSYSSSITLQIQVINATISPSGSSSICKGDSVIFSASPSVGYSYQWKKNGTIIPNANSHTYVAKDSGAYSVVISSTACSSTSAATSVFVNVLPVATITVQGSLTFCNGDSVVLKANTGVGLSYQWMKGAAIIPGATLANYSAKISGVYKVIVTKNTGCSKTSSSKTVVVNQLPLATITAQGATTFCAGDSVKLQANIISGATYSWKKGANFISVATQNFYTAKTAGGYRVQIINTNGCSKLSASTTVNVPCKIGNEDISTVGSIVISVSPNPSDGYFYFSGFDFENQTVSVDLYDTSGRKVVFDSDKIADNQLQINITVPGFYLACFNINGEIKYLKLIKN